MPIMDHEEEINRLHRRQGRTKFVVLLIVGFMALLTYLLISVSKQLAEGESMDFRSRASEFGMSSTSTTQTTSQQDGQSCYDVSGRSSGTFGRQYCENLKFACKNGFIDGKTAEGMRQAIEQALRARFNYTGTCSVGADGSVSCTNTSRSCPSFGSVARNAMKDFCKCETASVPGSGGSSAPPAAPPRENPPCVPTSAQWYRRGSCSQFEDCTEPYDYAFIVTCKDANGTTCSQGNPTDQSCAGGFGQTCNNRYQARANAYCGL